MGEGPLGFTYWPPQISQKRVEQLKFQFTYWPPKLSKKKVEPCRTSPYQSSPVAGPLPLVEPAYASLTVERAYASLPHFDWVEQAINSSSIYLLGGGALGFTYWPPQISQKRVEYLKVLSLTVEPAYASSPLPYGRAPKGPYQSST
jgi:hypothetical protein